MKWNTAREVAEKPLYQPNKGDLMVTKKPHDELAEKLIGKEVVVDTSILLDLSPAILKDFRNCTIIIPVVVIQELEKKRSHATLGYAARAWLRQFEELRIEHAGNLTSGVDIPGAEGVKLRIEVNHKNQSSLLEVLQNGSNDSTILAVANNLKQEKQERAEEANIVLLSRDVPMRIWASAALDIPAYDLPAKSKPFSGIYDIELSDAMWDEINDDLSDGLSLTDSIRDEVYAKLPELRTRNAAVRFNNNDNNVVVHINGRFERLPDVVRLGKTNVVARTMEQRLVGYYMQQGYDNLAVLSVGGKAGTGKTMMVLASAIEEVKSKKYRKIYVFRSLHEMGEGDGVGYLPGGLDEKMAPWRGAVDDALESIAMQSKKTKKSSGDNELIANTVIEKEKETLAEMIEVLPIIHLRGRSISNTIIIIEEAQNFSSSELLNIMSRAGDKSKIVLTFDAAQVDNRFVKPGDGADIWMLIDKLKDKGIAAHVTLSKTERSRVAEVASDILENG